jgi:hypothetical protein
MGKGRPPKIIVEDSNISWKRTRAKKTLMEIFPIITSEDMIFNYKEVEDKIQIRYTFQQITIEKKDLDKYLSPLNEEVSPELSIYLDEVYKKTQKQKI